MTHRGYSNEVSSTLPDASCDWVYIDGNHLHGFAKRDLGDCHRVVRSGGWITADDCREGGGWEGRVKRAVDAFAAGDGVDVVMTRHGRFVLEKAKGK